MVTCRHGRCDGGCINRRGQQTGPSLGGLARRAAVGYPRGRGALVAAVPVAQAGRACGGGNAVQKCSPRTSSARSYIFRRSRLSSKGRPRTSLKAFRRALSCCFLDPPASRPPPATPASPGLALAPQLSLACVTPPFVMLPSREANQRRLRGSRGQDREGGGPEPHLKVASASPTSGDCITFAMRWSPCGGARAVVTRAEGEKR